MKSTLKMCGINIVTHPHAPAGYVRLLQQVFKSRTAIPGRGAQHLMIGELKSINDERPEEGMVGRIYRFVNIDKNAQWFNVVRHDDATPEEVDAIHFPDELRPNTETFDFVFYPKGHTLYVNMRSENKIEGKYHPIGVGQVLKLLKSLMSLPAIHKQFGAVDVTAIPDREQLERILSIHQLSKLVIEVTRPNPDELGKAQERVFARFERMNVRKVRQEITAEKKESITVDAETRELAEVASMNGKVIGTGYTEKGQRIEESTVTRPWIGQVPYHPDNQTARDTLIAATAGLPGYLE